MISFTVIPLTPVTDKIWVDMRGAVWNKGTAECRYHVEFIINGKIVLMEELDLPAESNAGVYHRFHTAGHAGSNTLRMRVRSVNGVESASETLRVISSEHRSVNFLGGAWNGIYHWSEDEGRHWNSDIKNMSDDDWREQVRNMHDIGMDIMVIQETFRNQEYCHKHNVPVNGYKGRAYYPSELYQARMEMISAKDALEAILDEADKVGMKVFPGVGLYAWFDYTDHSLAWHKMVATELFRKYGHHKSFYGFYISEEIGGDMGTRHNECYSPPDQVIQFFREFQAHCRMTAPDKPVMLAPNCWYISGALDHWHKLLEYIDILCPFAFHRMNKDDITGEDAAQIFQDMADKTETHLWMDMELFLFDKTNALYPRPVEKLLEDMQRFPNFEKILGYQYAGLLCNPSAKVKLGGNAAIKLYNDYKDYYENAVKK